MYAAHLFVRTLSGFCGTSTSTLSFYHFSRRDIRKMLVAVLFLHAVSGLYAISSDQTSASYSICSSYPSQLSSQHCIVTDISKDSETSCERALAERNQLKHEVARRNKEIDKLRTTFHSVSRLLSIVFDQYEEESTSPTPTVIPSVPDTTDNSPKGTKHKGPPEDQQPGEEGNSQENSKKRSWGEAFKPSHDEKVDGQHPLKPDWAGENNQLTAQEVNGQPKQTQNLEEEGEALPGEHRDKRQKANQKGSGNKGRIYGNCH